MLLRYPLSAADLPAWLEEIGLYDRRALLGAPVLVLESRGRNLSFLMLEGGQPRFFVKQAIHSDSADVIAREHRILHQLAEDPAALVPRPLAHDQAMAALVNEAILGEAPRLEALDTVHLGALGARIAALHQRQLDEDMPKSEQPALMQMLKAKSTAYPATMALLARDPALPAAWETARQGWRTDAFVHGDLKPDNLLFAHDGRLHLIDWEMAGAGDPRWDIGQFLAYLITAMLFGRLDGATSAPVAERLDPSRIDRARLSAFALSYRAALGQGWTMSPATMAFYIGLGLSQQAYGLGRGLSLPDHVMVQLVQLAINLVRQPDAAASLLFEMSEA